MNDNYNSKYIREMIHLLEEKKFKELDKYRESIVPKKLYKFMSVNENKKLNESKIKCMKNNKIWLSSRKVLSDPFDLNAF